MEARIFRGLRVLEAFVVLLFVGLGVAMLVVGRTPHPLGYVLLGVAAFALLMFELRARGIRRSIARVTETLRSVGAADFDGASDVAERAAGAFEAELAANPSFAHILAGRALRLFIAARTRGRAVDVGTAILVGRDLDAFVSHVLVSTSAHPTPFRLMTRGAVTALARLGTENHPTTTGDVAFDAEWVVDAEPSLAARVLDANIRAQLIELRHQQSFMTVASVEMTKQGLILRWPGELDVAWAAKLRDLTVAIASSIERHAA